MAKRNRTTIGLLINQIEGRYQSLIHRGLSDFARDKNIDLVLFVGRSLSSPYDDEDRHNTIYSLARTADLDGLVVTAGSIGNFLAPEAMSQFLASFAPVPIVTIGMAVPGIPSIVSDNGNGISSLVKHLVTVHQFRRIAFLAGPETNSDAIARFEGFASAMKEQGLELQQELVFHGDFSYRSSQLLASLISTQNGLPFDAVVSANDEMAFGFLAALEEKGFTAPRDFAITGFDDVPDARFLTPSLTTVSQPLYEQGILAGQLLLSLMSNAKIPEVSSIPGVVTVRESCGCSDLPLVSSRPQSMPDSRDTRADINPLPPRSTVIDDTFKNLFLPEYRALQMKDALSALFDSLLLDLRSFRDHPLFLLTLNEWLDITADEDDFSEIWQLLLSRFHLALQSPVRDLRARVYIEDLFRNAFALLTRKSGRQSSRELAGLKAFLGNFREFSLRLGKIRSLDELLALTSETAPLVNLDRVFLCLHAGGPIPLPASGESPFYASMNCLYCASRSDPAPFPATEFHAADIIPSTGSDTGGLGNLVLMPLQGMDLSFGYVAFHGKHADALVYDTFRDLLSQAFLALDHFRKMKLAEEALDLVMEKLKASEERYREIARTVPMIVIETDISLAFRYVNRAGQDALGIGDNGDPITLRKFIHQSDLAFSAEIPEMLAQSGVIDYPAIRLVDRINRRYIPVIQISGIFASGGDTLTGLRWSALSPLPLAVARILPDKTFFAGKNISAREQDVLSLVLQGLRLKDISEKLFIAESTVKGHIGHIYDKLGISTRSELVTLIEEEQSRHFGYSAWLFSLVNRLLCMDAESSADKDQYQ